MNAAPFVFCGILFVTRFYHFTCGAALRLTLYSYVCVRAGIYLYVCVTFPESDYHICIRQCGGRCCVMGQCDDDDDDDDDSWAKGMAMETGAGMGMCFFGMMKMETGVNNDESNPHMQRESGRERESTPGLTCDICCKRHFTVQQGLIRIELHTQSGTRPLWLQTLRMTANFVCDAPLYACMSRCVCAGLFMHAYIRASVRLCVCVVSASRCVCGCVGFMTQLPRWQNVDKYFIITFYDFMSPRIWITEWRATQTHVHVHTLPHNTAS